MAPLSHEAVHCARGIGSELTWPDAWEHLTGPHPQIYNAAIPVAGACWLVTLAICIPHLRRLAAFGRRAAVTRLRSRQVQVLAAVPVVILTFRFAALLAPRIWKVLFCVAAMYEVFAFWTLKNFLFGMLAPSFDEAVKKLEDQHDCKMWAVLPFARCWRPCTPSRAPRRMDLLWVRGLVWQFIVLVPLMVVVEISEFTSEKVHQSICVFEVLSLMSAMYGIFALLEATHYPLEGKRTHAKFWVVKGTFIANMLVFRIACRNIHGDVRVGDLCYSSETVATAWCGLIASVFAALLAALVLYAYPVTDLIDNEADKYGEEYGDDDSTWSGEYSDGSCASSDDFRHYP